MNFLIVDNDFNARSGVTQTLGFFYPNSAVHEAQDIPEALAVLHEHRSIDLVLLDLNLEESRGIDTLKTIKNWCEEHDYNPRILVVSAAADYDDTLIPEAIEHCATGFITKGTSVEVFRSAIDLTLAGSIFIPQRYLQAAATRRKSPSPIRSGEESIAFTPREREVAALLMKGMSYKQIARRLAEPRGSMSEHTVRVHVQRMAWKLRVAEGIDEANMTAKAAVITAFAERRLHFS